jgi:CMP-N-acetylneuraminic acid synthetase
MNKKNKKVVAFVPIKLNSTRVPNKNLKLLGKKPLFRYILETLSHVKNIDQIYVFCSDKKIEKNLPNKIKFLKREKRLDSNKTLGEDIYDSFIKKVNADIYLLAHTTSPFVEAKNIDLSIKKVLSGKFDSAFSVSKNLNFAWYNNSPINYSLNKIPRTQDLEPIYMETSAFFIFNKSVWTSKKQRIGKKPFKCICSSIEAIDIDEPSDFKHAELICSGMNIK